jgi:hypothetical protein
MKNNSVIDRIDFFPSNNIQTKSTESTYSPSTVKSEYPLLTEYDLANYRTELKSLDSVLEVSIYNINKDYDNLIDTFKRDAARKGRVFDEYYQQGIDKYNTERAEKISLLKLLSLFGYL